MFLLSLNSFKIAFAVAFFSVDLEFNAFKISPISAFEKLEFKISQELNLISGEVNVPVLSVARTSRSAISSIADIFCGKTFA